MSSLDLGQSIAAQKTGLEAMFGILNKSFESIEKLASLNLQAFKSTLNRTQKIAVSALSANDPKACRCGTSYWTFVDINWRSQVPRGNYPSSVTT